MPQCRGGNTNAHAPESTCDSMATHPSGSTICHTGINTLSGNGPGSSVARRLGGTTTSERRRVFGSSMIIGAAGTGLGGWHLCPHFGHVTRPHTSHTARMLPCFGQGRCVRVLAFSTFRFHSRSRHDAIVNVHTSREGRRARRLVPTTAISHAAVSRTTDWDPRSSYVLAGCPSSPSSSFFNFSMSIGRSAPLRKHS